MKNIVITGGTDGMGKATAMHFLKRGAYVVVIGSTSSKGERFLAEARQVGAEDRATFIQADLSSIHENRRIIEAVKSRFDTLDLLMFCAARYPRKHVETADGLELIFAISYLSRYLLSYGLRDLLEKSQSPVILNVAAPGRKGAILWDDLNFKESFSMTKASFHSSRLNDLSGVAFVENFSPTNIKYILYNPGFVTSDGVMNLFDTRVSKLIAKIAASILGISPEESASIIVSQLEKPHVTGLFAYERQKAIPLTMETFNKENAQRLYQLTQNILQAGGILK